MSGVMLVKQRVGSIEQWNKVFRDSRLDGVRRDHGLVVTGTYVDADDPNTVIVVMDMHDVEQARRFASSAELATAREKAGAVGAPDGIWFGANRIQAE